MKSNKTILSSKVSLAFVLSISGISSSLAFAEQAKLETVKVSESISDRTREWLKDQISEIDLQDAVKFNYGIQTKMQGAGTPNQVGVGFFAPLRIGHNNVTFFDFKANQQLPDISNRSSIVNTLTNGKSISTSSRLGYRWLTNPRDWMIGVYGGYDSRPMNTGEHEDSSINVSNSQSAFFEQIALGIEAESYRRKYEINGNFPIGNTSQTINNSYSATALNDVGLKASYEIFRRVSAGVRYYYQWQNSKDFADGSGVSGEVNFEPCLGGIILGAQVSYDPFFKTRLGASFKYRFGLDKHTKKVDNSTKPTEFYKAPYSYPYRPELSPILALTSTPGFRDIRVADPVVLEGEYCYDDVSEEIVGSPGDGTYDSSCTLITSSSSSDVSSTEKLIASSIATINMGYMVFHRRKDNRYESSARYDRRELEIRIDGDPIMTGSTRTKDEEDPHYQAEKDVPSVKAYKYPNSNLFGCPVGYKGDCSDYIWKLRSRLVQKALRIGGNKHKVCKSKESRKIIGLPGENGFNDACSYQL